MSPALLPPEFAKATEAAPAPAMMLDSSLA